MPDSVEGVALRAAETLRGGEPPTLVLPTLWYGYSPHHMAFKGTVTLRSETFLAVVADIAESVLSHGGRRIVLLNGHGGNVGSLDVVASRLGQAWRGRARIAAVTYFHLAAARAAEFRQSADGGMGHACEFETSLQLALHPELVDMAAAITCYPTLPSPRQSTDLFGTSLVRAYHDFRDLSPSGVLGDPGAGLGRQGGDHPARVRRGAGRVRARLRAVADLLSAGSALDPAPEQILDHEAPDDGDQRHRRQHGEEHARVQEAPGHVGVAGKRGHHHR